MTPGVRQAACCCAGRRTKTDLHIAISSGSGWASNAAQQHNDRLLHFYSAAAPGRRNTESLCIVNTFPLAPSAPSLHLKMKEYNLYKSRRKAVKLFLLSSLFVIAGVFLLNQPNTSKFMAWSSILFFGTGIPLGLFQLLDRRPQIIINELGIFDRTIHQGFINWEIIHDAYLVSVHRQRFICLVVDEQFEPSKAKGRFGQKMASLSKAMGFQELNINVGNVQVDAERLLEFILAMRAADKPNRETLVRRELSNAV